MSRASRSGDAERLAHSRAYSGGMGWASSPLRNAPLRRVVEVVPGEYGRLEVLSCGHSMRPRSDMIGETSASRRRCLECPRLEDAGEALPPVLEEAAEERGARLLERAMLELVHHLRRVERCLDVDADIHEAVVELRWQIRPGSSAVQKRYGSLERRLVVDLVIELERLMRRRRLDPALRSSADRLRNMLASAWGMAR